MAFSNALPPHPNPLPPGEREQKNLPQERVAFWFPPPTVGEG